MAYSRRRRTTGVVLLPEEDMYGRRTVPGARPVLTERRLRRWSHARNTFFHRAKSGVHDPITFFHLVEELAAIEPGRAFTAVELARHLDDVRPALSWDAVVVGRILNDLVASWHDLNPDFDHQPITVTRHWSGREYRVSDFLAARTALFELLDDLVALGQITLEGEARHLPPDRAWTPLGGCPSLAR